MYKVPGPEELREWIRAKGLSVGAAAALVGAEPRAARRWTSPRDSKSFREIPWSAWALMRLMSGDSTVEEIRAEIEEKPATA